MITRETEEISDLISLGETTVDSARAASNELNAFINEWAQQVEQDEEFRDETIIGDLKRLEGFEGFSVEDRAKLVLAANRLGLDSREGIVEFSQNVNKSLIEKADMLPPKARDAIEKATDIIRTAPEETMEQIKAVIAEEDTQEYEVVSDIAQYIVDHQRNYSEELAAA